MTFAVQDVRDKLDGVFLPEGAERPLILRYDPNLDPILRIGMSTPAGRRDARPRARSWCTCAGWPRTASSASSRRCPAWPRSRCAAASRRRSACASTRSSWRPQGLDPDAVAARLAQENLNASGGMIREGSTEYLVRTLNEFADVEEIEDLRARTARRRGDPRARRRARSSARTPSAR